jgi:hypothetical protein
MFRKAILFLSFSFLISLIWLTTLASLEENVLTGGAKLLEFKWGTATLLDAYYSFIWFYLIILYKEKKATSKIIWLFATLFLGSMAASIYLIKTYWHAPKNAGLDYLFKKPLA